MPGLLCVYMSFIIKVVCAYCDALQQKIQEIRQQNTQYLNCACPLALSLTFVHLSYADLMFRFKRKDICSVH